MHPTRHSRISGEPFRRVMLRSSIVPRSRRDCAPPLPVPFPVRRGAAAVQDIQVERRPWGYRLGDIAVSVQVWHGDADRNVVIANGRYQAAEMPSGALHEIVGEGHWLIYGRFQQVLDSVTV